MGRHRAGEPLQLRDEDFLDGFVKNLAEFVGEGKAGSVFFRLEGNDGLAGDADAVGQLGLRPVEFGAEHAKAVFHRHR